jgi:hypothetical protein
VASGSTGDYRAARRAERVGKPLPVVEATSDPAPATPASPTEPKPLSRKEREQQDANDRVRRAVEAATADLRAQLDQLKAAPPAPRSEAPAPAAPAAPATPEKKEPAYKRYLAMPDAPKLADFDSVEEHSAAMAVFIDEQRTEERATADRQRTESDSLTEAQRIRSDKFVKQLHDARATDPEFVNKLTPEVRNDVKPFAALKPGEASGPINVIGEQVYDSPIAPKLLLHFSQHPEDLKRLITVPADIQALPAAARVRAHTQWMVREFGKLEGRLESPATPAAPSTPKPKTLTDAPPAAVDLGRRPAEAADPKAGAVKRGDTRAYREIRRQERLARLGR